MTGYGRGEAMRHGRSITVELRSVNNRYLDCTVKMPRSYIFAEDAIKTAVQAHISRGKVDVLIGIDSTAAEQVVVNVNQPVADAYYAALTQLRSQYQLQDDISVSLLARFPDVLLAEKAPADLEAVGADLVEVVTLAVESFNAMRTREGEKLAEDIRTRAERIGQLLTIVEKRGPETVAEYRAKLQRRMAEVLESTTIEESRILTEAAIFADKTAVDEETVRLRSHLAQLGEILAEGGIVGRKLDFLIQEFNREANTIGSKCGDVDITRTVLEIKGEIEKIREQVQNME